MLSAARLRIILRGCLLGLLFLPSTAAAQQQLATLQGTITDQTGALVPGVTVTATSVDTGLARTAVTNEAGVYRLPSLEPGRYRVSAELTGFNRAIRESITLEVGATVGLPFVLQAGSVSEEVEVRGEATAVQTERADISSVVERKRIEDLPLVSRNPLALTALQPGVTGIPTRNDFLQPEQGLGINASGMRGGANSAYVDGMSINANPHAGTVLIVPNVEAVQEFQVITNNPSAEHGRNIGASVNMVTRRGTNQFSGSAFQFYRNEALRSKNVFETGEKPEFRRNNFGFSLGGPVKRDRTFFFGSYEGLREQTASGALYTVETQQFRDFVLQTRPNSIAAQLLREFQPRTYPAEGLRDLGSPASGANVSGPPDGIPDVGTISLAIPSPRDGDQFNGRVDHAFRGGKDHLRSTYYLSNISTWFSDLREAFDRPYPHRLQLFTVGHSRVLSDLTLNELAFGYVRMHGEAADPTPQVPTISITGLSGGAGFGILNWQPIGFTQNYFQVKDTLTATRGRHSLRLGGEARVTMQYQDFHHFERPNYTFSNILDFADDEPFSEIRGVDPQTGLSRGTENRYLQTDLAMFVQDNWKIRSNLTANLGLRYEVFTSPSLADRPFNAILLGPGATRQEQVANARNGSVDSLYSTDWNNLAPRLGLTWDPTGTAKMVIRGGAGVSYNRINNTVWTGEWQNPPHFAQASTNIFDTSVPIVYTMGPNYPQNPGLGDGLDERGGIRGARISLTALDPEVETPYAYNWFVGAQRQLPWSFVVDVSYIGTAGRSLMSVDAGGGENYNRFTGDLLDGRLDRLNPSFAAVNLNESRISSRYDGLTLELRRRYGRGFAFQAAYTLGKATDTAGVWVDLTRPDLEEGPAGHDVRHRLAINQVFEIPVNFGNTVVRHLIGGWQISTITVWQTGSPFDISTSANYPNGDYNADGQNNDRPNAPASGTDLGSPSQEQWRAGVFTATDFPKPAPGTVGNLARNAYRGPGYLNTDLSLVKRVALPALTRDAGVQIRVEAYNLFNTINLNNPVTNLSSGLFGRVTSARPSREIQLGLRFTF